MTALLAAGVPWLFQNGLRGGSTSGQQLAWACRPGVGWTAPIRPSASSRVQRRTLGGPGRSSSRGGRPKTVATATSGQGGSPDVFLAGGLPAGRFSRVSRAGGGLPAGGGGLTQPQCRVEQHVLPITSRSRFGLILPTPGVRRKVGLSYTAGPIVGVGLAGIGGALLHLLGLTEAVASSANALAADPILKSRP